MRVEKLIRRAYVKAWDEGTNQDENSGNHREASSGFNHNREVGQNFSKQI